MNVNMIAYMVLGLMAMLLGVAVWCDVTSRRIPNWLVFTGMALGLVLNGVLPKGFGFNSYLPGGLGWIASLEGLAIGLAVMLPLYLLRAMGAGDVKLMAMVGAFLGVEQVLGAVVATFLVGGVMALAIALKTRVLMQVMSNLKQMMFLGAVKVSAGQVPSLEGTAVSTGRLPYAVAIAVGTMVSLVWHRML